MELQTDVQLNQSVSQTGALRQRDTLTFAHQEMRNARQEDDMQQKRAAAAAGAYQDLFAHLRTLQPAVIDERIVRLQEQRRRLLVKVGRGPESLRQPKMMKLSPVWFFTWTPEVLVHPELVDGVYTAIRRIEAQIHELHRQKKEAVAQPVVVPAPRYFADRLLAAPKPAPAPAPTPTPAPAPQRDRRAERTLYEALYDLVAQPCATVRGLGPTIVAIGNRYSFHQVVWNAKGITIVTPSGISHPYTAIPLPRLARYIQAAQRRLDQSERRRFETDLRIELDRAHGVLFAQRKPGQVTVCSQIDLTPRVTCVALNGVTKLHDPVPDYLYLRGHGPAWASEYQFTFRHPDDVHDIVDRCVAAHNAALEQTLVAEAAQPVPPKRESALARVQYVLGMIRALPIASPEYADVDPATRSSLVDDLRRALAVLTVIRQQGKTAAGKRPATLDPLRAIGRFEASPTSEAASGSATVQVQQAVTAIMRLARSSAEYRRLDAAAVQDAESLLQVIRQQIDRPGVRGRHARQRAARTRG